MTLHTANSIKYRKSLALKHQRFSVCQLINHVDEAILSQTLNLYQSY